MTESHRPPESLLEGLPNITRRIVDAGCNIMETDINNPTFMHAVLCQVGLPRSRVEGRTFERTNGKASIFIEAGHMPTLFGRWVEAPLPYGVKPRLVMHYMCSEAIRTQSPFITLDQSMNKFLERLGIGNGNSRQLKAFKQQMLSLSTCSMKLAFFDGNRVRMTKADPVKKFDAWLSPDVNQKALWDDHIELGQDFFETLCEHAVPLDPRAIHALQHSALAMDVYTWLAHRLCRVRKKDGVKLSWRNLKEQFGQEYKCSKDFKRSFKDALMKARSVYAHADIDIVMGGLLLKPSPPPIKKTQIVVPMIEKASR